MHWIPTMRTARRILFTSIVFILSLTIGFLPRGVAQSGDSGAALLAAYTWRSIGPASAGGRITGNNRTHDTSEMIRPTITSQIGRMPRAVPTLTAAATAKPISPASVVERCSR